MLNLKSHEYAFFCLQYSKTYIFKLLRTVDTLTTVASCVKKGLLSFIEDSK